MKAIDARSSGFGGMVQQSTKARHAVRELLCVGLFELISGKDGRG